MFETYVMASQELGFIRSCFKANNEVQLHLCPDIITSDGPFWTPNLEDLLKIMQAPLPKKGRQYCETSEHGYKNNNKMK